MALLTVEFGTFTNEARTFPVIVNEPNQENCEETNKHVLSGLDNTWQAGRHFMCM